MKKRKNGARASNKTVFPELPQNITPVGERVFEDKNIYINQKVYKQIHDFSANKTENEHGGILVGRVVNELGKENTIIEGFIEAKYNNATPTTLTFTHETWEHFHAEIDKKHKGKKIVGWIHTHPNFGIFLSENDRFIQQNFFTDSNQVAYVVDPIQKEEGFFYWIEDKLERCPGFYLFDKNGVKIKQKIWGDDTTYDEPEQKSSSGILQIIMAIIIVINIFVMMSQSARINRLEKNIQDMTTVINSQGMILQQAFPMLIPPQTEKENKEVSKPDGAQENIKNQEQNNTENGGNL